MTALQRCPYPTSSVSANGLMAVLRPRPEHHTPHLSQYERLVATSIAITGCLSRCTSHSGQDGASALNSISAAIGRAAIPNTPTSESRTFGARGPRSDRVERLNMLRAPVWPLRTGGASVSLPARAVQDLVTAKDRSPHRNQKGVPGRVIGWARCVCTSGAADRPRGGRPSGGGASGRGGTPLDPHHLEWLK